MTLSGFRSAFRRLTPLALAVTSGCTVVADPSSYVADVGCDLDLRLIQFDGPHLGMDLTVQIDSPPDGTRETRGIAMVVGIPSGKMHFQVPAMVHYGDSSIDFFVDNAAPMGIYNPTLAGTTQRGDHSWTIEPACTNGTLEFTHVANFDDFEEYTALDDDLVFDLVGFGLAADPIEVRVVQYDPELDAVDGDGDGRFTLAFQHTTSATDGMVTGRFLTTRLRGMLDRGADFDVELFVDRDGDQLVDDSSTPGDPNDEGYVFRFSADPGSHPGTMPIPNLGPVPLDASLAGTDDHSGTVGLVVEP